MVVPVFNHKKSFSELLLPTAIVIFKWCRYLCLHYIVFALCLRFYSHFANMSVQIWKFTLKKWMASYIYIYIYIYIKSIDWWLRPTITEAAVYSLQNRCSQKFCNIHRKAPVLEPSFNKGADLKGNFSREYCKMFENSFFFKHL